MKRLGSTLLTLFKDVFGMIILLAIVLIPIIALFLGMEYVGQHFGVDFFGVAGILCWVVILIVWIRDAWKRSGKNTKKPEFYKTEVKTKQKIQRGM